MKTIEDHSHEFVLNEVLKQAEAMGLKDLLLFKASRSCGVDLMQKHSRYSFDYFNAGEESILNMNDDEVNLLTLLLFNTPALGELDV